jgi:TetR/AcrR family transcriptional regulator
MIMQTRGDVARAKMLQEAFRAFARFGYDGTRLDKVAETLGVTRQALLFHFKDKRGLYEAALELLFGQREEALDSRPREDFSQLADYVDYLVDYSARYYLQNPEYMRLLLRLLLGEGPGAAEAPRAGRGMVERWEAVLAEGQQGSVTRAVPVSSLVAVIGGTLSYYMLLPQGARTGVNMMNYDPLDELDVAQITGDLQRAVRGLLGLAQI